MFTANLKTNLNMYFKLLCAFICLTGTRAAATNICSNSSPCKCITSPGVVIDISSVGIVGRPKFYELKNINSSDEKLYTYNPCYAFDSPDPYAIVKPENKPCKAASSCVRIPGSSTGNPPEEYALGIQSEGKFDSDDKYGFHINYTVPGAKQSLTVTLTCKNDSKDHNLTILDPISSDHFHMELVSKCACANGCVGKDETSTDEGLSTGSKLLIAFFTILLAYFVIGLVWNLFNGAHGLELVPNIEFWNELPKLIVEGLVFTCSCFGRQSSYGEV